jgi:Zn-dependent protease
VSDAAGASAYSVPIWAKVLFYLGLTNVWLGIFNLLPLPPLDGSVLVERMLPARWWPAYLRVRPYSMFVIVGLFLLDSITHAGVLNHLSNDVFEWWGRVCFGS